MRSLTPDEVAMLVAAIFMAGFAAIAVWLLRR
jgi:hypothetical protein